MDSKCNKINCICTHTDGCEKGFIFIRYCDKKIIMQNSVQTTVETWYDGVRFCPICDPERAHIQTTSTTSEEMQQRLRNRSSLKSSDNYDKEEATRTRTL